eukprot:351486-Chlamydomonas_euryale.AAC.15
MRIDEISPPSAPSRPSTSALRRRSRALRPDPAGSFDSSDSSCDFSQQRATSASSRCLVRASASRAVICVPNGTSAPRAGACGAPGG